MKSSTDTLNRTDTDAASREKHRGKPKWFAQIDDKIVAVPDATVAVSVLKTQAGVADGHVLVRDHNSQNDVVLDGGVVDLREGNVFYSIPAEQVGERTVCRVPAKRAILVDDRAEEIGTPHQTGGSIRELFELPKRVDLFRDLHSPNDQSIDLNTAVEFQDGPVFYTRTRVQFTIFVNKLAFTKADGAKKEMTGREIAELVEKEPQNTKVERITGGQKTKIELDETVAVQDRDEFKVIRCNVNAGFQSDRIERELARLRESGLAVRLVAGHVPAVIYCDVPVRDGLPVRTTDVLVKVPSGYPGGIIDNAFLPVGSPLLNCTPGETQQTETIDGRQWTQKSVHPHAPQAAPWDKERHGFDTYYSEVQNWLHAGS
jgi:hypothetical protein